MTCSERSYPNCLPSLSSFTDLDYPSFSSIVQTVSHHPSLYCLVTMQQTNWHEPGCNNYIEDLKSVTFSRKTVFLIFLHLKLLLCCGVFLMWIQIMHWKQNPSFSDFFFFLAKPLWEQQKSLWNIWLNNRSDFCHKLPRNYHTFSDLNQKRSHCSAVWVSPAEQSCSCWSCELEAVVHLLVTHALFIKSVWFSSSVPVWRVSRGTARRTRLARTVVWSCVILFCTLEGAKWCTGHWIWRQIFPWLELYNFSATTLYVQSWYSDTNKRKGNTVWSFFFLLQNWRYAKSLQTQKTLLLPHWLVQMMQKKKKKKRKASIPQYWSALNLSEELYFYQLQSD